MGTDCASPHCNHLVCIFGTCLPSLPLWSQFLRNEIHIYPTQDCFWALSASTGGAQAGLQSLESPNQMRFKRSPSVHKISHRSIQALQVVRSVSCTSFADSSLDPPSLELAQQCALNHSVQPCISGIVLCLCTQTVAKGRVKIEPRSCARHKDVNHQQAEHWSTVHMILDRCRRFQ